MSVFNRLTSPLWCLFYCEIWRDLELYVTTTSYIRAQITAVKFLMSSVHIPTSVLYKYYIFFLKISIPSSSPWEMLESVSLCTQFSGFSTISSFSFNRLNWKLVMVNRETLESVSSCTRFSGFLTISSFSFNCLSWKLVGMFFGIVPMFAAKDFVRDCFVA